jgi:hypothetical protein
VIGSAIVEAGDEEDEGLAPGGDFWERHGLISTAGDEGPVDSEYVPTELSVISTI